MNKPDALPRKTSRIVLRRLTLADLPGFHAYRADPELGRYQGWEPMSEEEASTFLGGMEAAGLFIPGRWCQLAIADPSGNEILGDIGICLSEDESEAEIGFTLKSSQQGKGLASEALGEAIRLIFERTPARRVKGITDSRNLRSISTLMRVGMARVEELQTTFRGEPCTEYVYLLQRCGEKPQAGQARLRPPSLAL